MLTSLRIQNFKSWADTGEMRLAPITGLFGANSSGKTSILQFLLLLKQTVESTDRTEPLDLGDERSLVNLGTFTDVLHWHAQNGRDFMSSDATIAWTFAWSLPQRIAVSGEWAPLEIHFEADSLRFEAEVASLHTKRPAAERFMYHALTELPHRANQGIGTRRKPGTRDRYEITSEGLEPALMMDRPQDLPPPIKCYGFPPAFYTSFTRAGFASLLQAEFESLFDRLYYLGPLREYPSRQYTWGGSVPADVGHRGERVIEALLASRDRVGGGVEARVAAWLQRLGLIDAFTIEPVAPNSSLFQVWVQRAAGSARVLITDVGFGVSQILPVLAICYYVPEGSTIILEQPEIHLHPAVQAGLADVLIDAVKTRGVQIILESHSEHLLARLQRRIAEEAIPAGDVALYFCTMDDGTSKLTSLQLDDYGNITNWPQGFFGDDMGDRWAMLDAEMRRREARAR